VDPDPNSKSNSYDPTRECFNIKDGAVATTDDTEDDGIAAAALAVGANPPPPQDDKAMQLAQLRELKSKLDEDREQLDQLEQALEQDQVHPHGGGTHCHGTVQIIRAQVQKQSPK
jgi:hypothetical protein